MDPQDFSVALRIRHPSIDPAELSRRLGIEPQHAWRAGDPRHLAEGEVGSRTYRETYWVGFLAPSPPLEPSLLGLRSPRLVGMLRNTLTHPQTALYFALLMMKRATAFWRTFAEQGGTIECLLQVHKADRFQLEMSQALLLALVELKITLSIEVDSALRATA